MLEEYFRSVRTRTRLASAEGAEYHAGFIESLGASGFAARTIARHIRAAAHVGVWMESRHQALNRLNEDALSAFAAHLRRCRCRQRRWGDRSHGVEGARLFVSHLRQCGVVPERRGDDGGELPEVIRRFEQWMVLHRGVTESTLRTDRSILVEFVQEVTVPHEVTAAALRRFFSKRAQQRGPSRTKTTACALRMLVRFLAVDGVCSASLLGALPPIAHWRLAALPAYVSAEDVERIVAAVATTTAAGRRDRAILLLLARLGLRAGDVIELRLQDIDWTTGTVRVRGKGKRPVTLPLPQDVGDAILAYLAQGRPVIDDDHVFLAVQAPCTELRSSAAVSDVVCRAAVRAGVTLPRQGAHVLRHSAATTLVRMGVPLHAVGMLLRHRGEEATAHYAKVDVPALLRVAQPWPAEVSPC